MADTTNLTNFLQDIADSIKAKKDYPSSQKISAADFDTEIEGIETGVDVSGVTATAGDVRETKKFVNSNGEEVQGTFPNATAVYEQQVVNPIKYDFLSSARSELTNSQIDYFDNIWYYVTGNTLIVENNGSQKTYTLEQTNTLANTGYNVISVGCKDYFEEDTVLILCGYNTSMDYEFYLFNYTTSELEYKATNTDDYAISGAFMNPYYPTFCYYATNQGQLSSRRKTINSNFTVTQKETSMKGANGYTSINWVNSHIFCVYYMGNSAQWIYDYYNELNDTAYIGISRYYK